MEVVEKEREKERDKAEKDGEKAEDKSVCFWLFQEKISKITSKLPEIRIGFTILITDMKWNSNSEHTINWSVVLSESRDQQSRRS